MPNTEWDGSRGIMDSESHASGAPRRYRRVLTIAGSDSGGGAGIQADLKTVSALGCYGMTVITALTAQNTTGVSGIHPVPPEFAARQMDAVFSDIGADAVKIGMLFSAELIETVAERLKAHSAVNIVLDPVMVAASGDKLLQDDAIAAVTAALMPLTLVATPNLPEAQVLTGRTIGSLADMRRAAQDLARFGCRNVLVKGGHRKGGDSTDVLYLADTDRLVDLGGSRIATPNNHGTGCTLSSAIAAYLARGESVETAVVRAKRYISAAIQAGARYRLGHGHGPVHHFYRFWE
jgi:hydroxymethylpyrimidine/phosphomethylpyrimidine kinase